MYKIIVYKTARGDVPLKEYFDYMTARGKEASVTRARFYIKLLEEHGKAINMYQNEAMKPIDDRISELRPGKIRILFFEFHGNQFVLLHGFTKSTQKTPKLEKNKAKSEMNDFLRRNE